MLTQVLRQRGQSLTFTIVDVGALPLWGQPEPYHRLIAEHPGSRVLGFEIDPQACAQLNQTAPDGLRYHACALGRADETRPFYETEHPMCASLYPPSEAVAARYNNLGVMKLRRKTSIRTRPLDAVAQELGIGPVDFLKLDVQGAELDVLQGGEAALRDALVVLCEVEFVPLYDGQPLYGEVTAWLASRGLAFHKFLGLSGRALAPVVVNGDPNFAVQHLWADALYLRDLSQALALAPPALLKMAVLLDLYGSPDVAYHLLRAYDERSGTWLAEAYLAAFGGVRPPPDKAPAP